MNKVGYGKKEYYPIAIPLLIASVKTNLELNGQFKCKHAQNSCPLGDSSTFFKTVLKV